MVNQLFLEERVSRRLRCALSLHFRFKANNLFLQQADAIGQLTDGKQRQILPHFVTDFLSWQIVGIYGGHVWRFPFFARKLTSRIALVTLDEGRSDNRYGRTTRRMRRAGQLDMLVPT